MAARNDYRPAKKPAQRFFKAMQKKGESTLLIQMLLAHARLVVQL